MSENQSEAHNEWKDPFGAWSDLPDTMLDATRHETEPSRPLDDNDVEGLDA